MAKARIKAEPVRIKLLKVLNLDYSCFITAAGTSPVTYYSRPFNSSCRFSSANFTIESMPLWIPLSTVARKTALQTITAISNRVRFESNSIILLF